MHRAASAVVVACLAVSLLPRAHAQQAPTPLDKMYLAFAGGDADIVARTLRTRDDFSSIRADVFASIGKRKRDWRPTHAALLFEIAFVGLERGWPDSIALLEATRDLVIGRKDPPGAKPAIDAFEIAFHHAAIGALHYHLLPQTALEYLKVIDDRVTAVEQPGKPLLVDPLMPFTRGLTVEMMTFPSADRSDRGYSWVADARDNGARRALPDALAAMTEAAQVPQTAPEAGVRRAFLLHRLGRNDQALAALDAVRSTDVEVTYWSWLIRGRVLGALGRTDDAARAYEQAAGAQPQAATPAVALAALLFGTERREEALHWAEIARTRPDRPLDPWLVYFGGDGRRLAGWLQALREARP
jgi:tetratricopeptide (TPR) repeat protein